MNRNLFAGLMASILLALASPVALADWDKTFGGADSDGGNSIQQTSDGGYIIAGYTMSQGAGESDVWLIKTDAGGNMQWDKTFGGSNYDYCGGVRQTTDGGYIIAGDTMSYGAGGYDVWLIKTDASGIKQWDTTFGGTGWDHGESVRQTADGGYIIVGSTESYGAGDDDVWLIKTDADGNKQWDTTFGGTGWDEGAGVEQTPDGGYIVTGATQVPDMLFFLAAWLIKTDAGGNMLWDSTFGDMTLAGGKSVQQTADGGYIITGGIKSPITPPYYDVLLVKTDAAGNGQWTRTFGGIDYDLGTSVQQTADGGYIIAGHTSSYGAGDFDVWLIRTDAGGNKQWDKTFGGAQGDYGYGLEQIPDGAFVIVGYTESYGAGRADVWLIKTSPPELTGIHLASPVDQSALTLPPTLVWTPDGGTTNVFVVDFHIPGLVALWTTPLLSETGWTVPAPVWKRIPVGKKIYWRVRGADLDDPPLNIITSDEVWSFTKQ